MYRLSMSLFSVANIVFFIIYTKLFHILVRFFLVLMTYTTNIALFYHFFCVICKKNVIFAPSFTHTEISLIINFTPCTSPYVASR